MMLENSGLVPAPSQKEECETSSIDKKITLSIAMFVILEIAILAIFWSKGANTISSDRDGVNMSTGNDGSGCNKSE